MESSYEILADNFIAGNRRWISLSEETGFWDKINNIWNVQKL